MPTKKEYSCALFNARLLKPALVAYEELCRNDAAADAAVAVGLYLLLLFVLLQSFAFPRISHHIQKKSFHLSPWFVQRHCVHFILCHQ